MNKKLKKIVLAFMFTALIMVSANAQKATLWKLDKVHTSIDFSINHFFSAVTGNFTNYEGTFYFDRNNLQESKVTFSIPVSSINTNNAKRDGHLKSPDFFDSKKYPDIKFNSTRFEKKSENNFIVYGKLTIRDITKDIVLPFKITGEIEHPMMKGTIILGIALQTELKRIDYGVGKGNWAATKVVGNNVDININMELNRMKKQ